MSFDFIVLCLSNSNHPENKMMNLGTKHQHLPQKGQNRLVQTENSNRYRQSK